MLSQRGEKRQHSLRGAVPLSHFFLRERVRAGDFVLDATCGNGFDTLLLAELAGEGGKVWAFDVQARAIDATRALLAREGRLAGVELIEAGHERLSEFVGDGVQLKAAVFNLGYLPGSSPEGASAVAGEGRLVTSPENTVAALGQAAALLQPGGIITISLYTGHEGGPEEALAVERWGAALPPRAFNVWSSRQLNRPAVAPYLILVERT